jgi:ABC-2 type transport system ATP-binding protein
MSTETVIEIDGLKKNYNDGWGRTVKALGGVSFSVRKGEIFGLLGPNGAGKTTAVKVLLGIVQATAGKAEVLGRPAGDIEARGKIGYLPENLKIPSHHTAFTALDYYGGLSGMNRDHLRQRRQDMLETVELTDWAHHEVTTFSKGMKQRLGLAQAMLHDPEILILDEPTDGLDPVGRRQVRELLKRLRGEGKTIFINSHLLQEVEMVCDHIAVLDWGQLKFTGTVTDFTFRHASEGELEIDLKLVGEHRAIQDAVKSCHVLQFDEVEDGEFELLLRLTGQDAVDRCVDDLRCSGVSIIGLTRQRVSLEDAFLKVLGRDIAEAETVVADS